MPNKCVNKDCKNEAIGAVPAKGGGTAHVGHCPKCAHPETLENIQITEAQKSPKAFEQSKKK